MIGHWYAIYVGHVVGLSVTCERTVAIQQWLTAQWFVFYVLQVGGFSSICEGSVDFSYVYLFM